MSKVTLFHMYLATGDNQVQTCTHNRKCITGGLKRAEGGSPHDAHSLLLNAARYLFHVLFAHGLQCNITWTKDYLMSNLTALDIRAFLHGSLRNARKTNSELQTFVG